MVLTSFPFDKQRCYLKFSSWSYDGEALDIILPDNAFDSHSEYHENGEWYLLGTDTYNKTHISYDIPSENDTDSTPEIRGTWPKVFFEITLKRKANFYLFTLLLPYFLISSLSGLVFILQPDSGEKMGMAVTTLLSLVVFNEYVMQIVPPSSDYFPLLGKYQCVNLTLLPEESISHHSRGLPG